MVRGPRGWRLPLLAAVVGLLVAGCGSGESIEGSARADPAALRALQAAADADTDAADDAGTDQTTQTTDTAPATPTAIETIDPFAADGSPTFAVFGGDVTGACTQPSPSSTVDDVFRCDLMPGHAGLCWPGDDDSEAWCLEPDPRQESLFIVRTTQPLTPVSGDAAAEPWALELAEGAFCYRTSTSTAGGLSLAGYYPDYTCDGGPADDAMNYVIYADETTGAVTDRSTDAWTVQAGDVARAARDTAAVTRAYFPVERPGGIRPPAEPAAGSDETDPGDDETASAAPCPSRDEVAEQYREVAWVRCFDDGYLVTGQYFADAAPDDYDGFIRVLRLEDDGSLRSITGGSDYSSYDTSSFPTALRNYLTEPTIALRLGPGAFSTPSGNIHCSVSPRGALCSIDESDALLPREVIDRIRDRGCSDRVTTGRPTLADVEALTVDDDGPGDILCGRADLSGDAPVLGYGAFVETGEYVCDSRTDGVRCENTSTGHGFHLRRSAFELY